VTAGALKMQDWKIQDWK